MNRSTEVRAITQLVDDVPELQPLWAEHVADNGEPLPQVFFGDLSRFAVELAERGDPRAISDFAAAIERVAANPDPAVRNLMHVSFAEHFVWGDDRDQRALRILQPSFCAETLKRFEESQAWSDEASVQSLGTDLT